MQKSIPMYNKNTKKSNISIKLIFHIVFCWLRIAILVMGYLYAINNTENVHLMANKLNFFYYTAQFNMFLLYLIVSSIFQRNLFKYNITVFWMLRNAILMIRGMSSVYKGTCSTRTVVLSLICIVYLVEGLVSIYLSYSMMNESFQCPITFNMDNMIKEAYETRKCLQTFDEINIFTAFIIFEKYFYTSQPFYVCINLNCLIFIVITLFQQLAITMFFYKENVIQRKIAIFLSFFKLPIMLILMVLAHDEQKKTPTPAASKMNSFYDLIIADAVVLTLATIFFLIKDYSRFGSGLKPLLSNESHE